MILRKQRDQNRKTEREKHPYILHGIHSLKRDRDVIHTLSGIYTKHGSGR